MMGVAVRLAMVTLSRAFEAGEPAVAAGRIEFAVALDPHGQPDLQAWLQDPEPWPARRLPEDGPPQDGDVAHDEEGWQLRFHAADGPDPDGPAHRIVRMDGGLRPGEIVALCDPEGEESSWRVVGVAMAAQQGAAA
jgi:hypothetical protein